MSSVIGYRPRRPKKDLVVLLKKDVQVPPPELTSQVCGGPLLLIWD